MTRLVAQAMTPGDRDMRVLKLVAQYRQLATSHIKALMFDDVGYTPVYRSLKRLTKHHHYLIATERPNGGSHGGSGQYTYSLSERGFNLLFIGEYSRPRSIDLLHTLAIADCAVVIHELERAGKLRIVGLVTEPEAWQVVGGIELRPDLFVELERAGQSRQLWLEVERSSKGHKQLTGKLMTYWNAYRYSDESDMPEFPKVLWVCVYPETANKLRGLIRQLPANAQELFEVTTLSDLAAFLS